MPTENKDDAVKTLKQIAMIAHCGGLAGLDEDRALVAIRRLSLRYWDSAMHGQRAAEIVKDAVSEAFNPEPR